MFSIRHYVILAVLIFIGKAALAGVLIEPYVGYSLGGKIKSNESAGASESDYSGLNLGGRFGAQYLGLMGGLAYDHGSYTETLKSPASDIAQNIADGVGNDTDWTANSYGLFVGYNFPILLRVWGTYFFKSDWEADATKGGSTKGDKLKSSAYELGLGYTALPFLSLNAQYRATNFDKYEYSGNLNGNLSDTTAKSFILSVSLPINF